MARRRFFVERIRNGRAVLEGDDARHLRKVLRAEAGQRYELSDNESVYLAEIEGFARDEVVFRVIEELPAGQPHARLILLAALIRFERFEWLLEKATELGVEQIVPIQAERSEKGLERAAAKRLERWLRIVRESSQQARRARLPQLALPALFSNVIRCPYRFRYLLDESSTEAILPALPAPDQRTPADTIALLVGPEGGWTEGERAAALSAGWLPVSVGPHILRAETAAVAALAVLANAWLTSPPKE